MTLQAIDFCASADDLLYTLTADDGSVIGTDLPPTSTGVAVCAGTWYVEPASGRLWIVHATGDVTVHVVDPGDRGGGGGCSAGHGDATGLALIALGLAAITRRGCRRIGANDVS